MFTVREARNSDMDAVKILDKQTMGEPMENEERSVIRDFERYHDEFWSRMTQTPGTRFYVAEDSGGRVVGMIWLAVQERISGATFGWIHDLTVERESRGKGIGRMLLQRAIEHFKGYGV